MSEETYYTVLGVAETATANDIKRAYRSLLKKIHPDTVSTLSEETRRGAEDATREINEAYSVLSDQGQRAEYDFFLADQRKARAVNQEAPAAASMRPTERTTPVSKVPVSHEHGRRRRRRRSHRRHHSSRHGSRKSLFRPVSITDWLVLFGYVFLALVLVAIAVMIISSAPEPSQDSSVRSTGQETKALSRMNGAGDRDRTGDIQLGKLAFYR